MSLSAFIFTLALFLIFQLAFQIHLRQHCFFWCFDNQELLDEKCIFWVPLLPSMTCNRCKAFFQGCNTFYQWFPESQKVGLCANWHFPWKMFSLNWSVCWDLLFQVFFCGASHGMKNLPFPRNLCFFFTSWSFPWLYAKGTDGVRFLLHWIGNALSFFSSQVCWCWDTFWGIFQRRFWNFSWFKAGKCTNFCVRIFLSADNLLVNVCKKDCTFGEYCTRV